MSPSISHENGLLLMAPAHGKSGRSIDQHSKTAATTLESIHPLRNGTMGHEEEAPAHGL